jgi:hypothetical protein
MTNSPLWAHIPHELLERHQWLVAGADKAPLGISANGTTFNAKVNDPRSWLPFDVAAQYAYTHGLHIGYVLSSQDPFTCIDLDWTDEESQKRKGKPVDPSKWSTQDDLNLYYQIIQRFATYTERSTNGKGLHLWAKGKIGLGCRLQGVEVYSQERFIVCTGDRLAGTSPNIEERSEYLEAMVASMRSRISDRGQLHELEELPEDPDDIDERDQAIFIRASDAENGHKFNELCAGRWEQYGFPSQSEADLALMSMFTFYSPINSQCRRLFRMTELGKREKSIKNDKYLNFTLKLIRHRQKNEEITPQEMELAAQSAAAIMESAKRKHLLQEATPLHSPLHTTTPAPVPTPVALATLSNAQPGNQDGLPFPPGLAGAIAQFIYSSSPRPVPEVAIVSALGLLAGICGKAWHIPQSGLNLYVILVARSGVGKEAMHSGISAIMKACMLSAPMISRFVSFNNFASGPALTKFCAENDCFVNVSGEWGRKLKRLAMDDMGDSASGTLRTVMTDLYQKSGPQAIVGGLSYSNKDNNVQSVSGVSYSMIGETTPDTLYESLTESMMHDGFLSRFTIVEYKGGRPPMNMYQNLIPPKPLTDAISNLVVQASQILGAGGVMGKRDSVLVGRTEEAAALLHEFELECDNNINANEDEFVRQMWNRAALKVLRIASLLSVADNYAMPCVQLYHVVWALDVIRRDIALMGSKISSGDVGISDYARRLKVIAVIKEYFSLDKLPASYNVPEKMRPAGVVPYNYLQIRVGRLAAFSKHRNGSNNALQDVLRTMIQAGDIVEIDKGKAKTDYDARGVCYMVLRLPQQSA